MNLDKYHAIDDALLVQIAAGRNTFGKLISGDSEVFILVKPFLARDPWRGYLTPTSRVVANRLQYLKRRGAIIYDGSVWHIANNGMAVSASQKQLLDATRRHMKTNANQPSLPTNFSKDREPTTSATGQNRPAS